MRRLRAGARLVALVVGLAAVLVAVPAASAAPPNAADLESEIVCPVCGTTLDLSNAEVAEQMKALIRDRISQGWSEREIKAELVDQFGPAVLAEPQKRGLDLVAWALPVAGGVVGAVALGLAAWHWARRRETEPNTGTGAEPGAEPDAELERRLDQALAEFDA